MLLSWRNMVKTLFNCTQQPQVAHAIGGNMRPIQLLVTSSEMVSGKVKMQIVSSNMSPEQYKTVSSKLIPCVPQSNSTTAIASIILICFQLLYYQSTRFRVGCTMLRNKLETCKSKQQRVQLVWEATGQQQLTIVCCEELEATISELVWCYTLGCRLVASDVSTQRGIKERGRRRG